MARSNNLTQLWVQYTGRNWCVFGKRANGAVSTLARKKTEHAAQVSMENIYDECEEEYGRRIKMRK